MLSSPRPACRRRGTRCPLATVLAAVAIMAVPTAPAAEPPPNIVILFADDLGYGDLGCYGHPTIRTPHLDRMAAEGMRFTAFYSAAEVCTPSRAALLTGRYPVRSGMCHDRFRVLRRQSLGHLPAAEITLAELLRDRGYATACIGKWHLGNFANEPAGHPLEHGFDVFFGLPHSNDMDPAPGAPKGAPGRPDQDPTWWNAPLYRGTDLLERPADQTALTRRTIDEAVDFIEGQAEQPFFLYVPFSFPHVPLFASAEFRGRSPRGLYGDVIEELDAGVGRILDLLRRRNLAGRTLVVFTSDNGPWLTMNEQGGSAGLLREGKGSTWEGGMRVPAIAWRPGHVPAGTVHRGIATTLDLFPTAARLAGATLPTDRPIDGVDLSSTLAENEEAVREAFFYYRGGTLFAARRGRFKAHFLTQGAYGDPEPKRHDPPLLYDLEADPAERFDVASAHPAEAAALVAAARAHQASFTPAPSQLVATVDEPARASPPPAAARP
jgi:arylsulfatase A